MRLYLQNAKSELPIYHYNVPIVQKKERRKKTRTTAAANRTEERWWFAACRPDNRVLVFELRGSSSVSRRWMLRLRVQVFASRANLSWGFLHHTVRQTQRIIINGFQMQHSQAAGKQKKKSHVPMPLHHHVVTAAPSGDPLAIHVRRLLTPGKDKASIVVAKEVPVNRVNEWVNVVEQNGPNFNPDYCWGHTRRYLL